MKHFLINIFRITVGIAVIGLFAGKIFFPKKLEETIISPARKMPIFGQVLGTTWNEINNLNPNITRQTQKLTQQIETHDIDPNKMIDTIVNSNDPKQLIENSIQQQIDQQSQKIKNLPENVIKNIKDEVYRQLFMQICQNLATNSSSINQ